MPELARWAVSIVTIGSFALLLHWIAGRFAPRSEGDPRLGTTGFWVWVALTAAFVHYVLEPYDLAPRLRVDVPDKVKWAALAIWAMLWAAGKLGLLDAPHWLEQTQEDHEEWWATMVGCVVGFLVPAILRRALQ